MTKSDIRKEIVRHVVMALQSSSIAHEFVTSLPDDEMQKACDEVVNIAFELRKRYNV